MGNLISSTQYWTKLENGKYICYHCNNTRESKNIYFSDKLSFNKLRLNNLLQDLENFKCIDKYKCCDKEGSRRLKLIEYDTMVRNENRLKK